MTGVGSRGSAGQFRCSSCDGFSCSRGAVQFRCQPPRAGVAAWATAWGRQPVLPPLNPDHCLERGFNEKQNDNRWLLSTYCKGQKPALGWSLWQSRCRASCCPSAEIGLNCVLPSPVPRLWQPQWNQNLLDTWDRGRACTPACRHRAEVEGSQEPAIGRKQTSDRFLGWQIWEKKGYKRAKHGLAAAKWKLKDKRYHELLKTWAQAALVGRDTQ